MREEGGRRGGGGGAADAGLKTKTPHVNVGNKSQVLQVARVTINGLQVP